MELALIRSLMDKDFYDEHRGSKCPDRLFSKDVRKIKSAIDDAMGRYERSVTPDEIEALFLSSNPTLTTAQKNSYISLFKQIKKVARNNKTICWPCFFNSFCNFIFRNFKYFLGRRR